MNIDLGTIRSSPFVGVFAVATDKVVLLPELQEVKEKKKLEKLFDCEKVYTRLANSSLLGVLAAGNSNGFVVGEIAEEQELEALERNGIIIKKVLGITALGNLMGCNDKVAFCAKTLPDKAVKTIGEALKVKCVRTEVAGSDLIGSAMVLTNKGFIAHPMISEEEFKVIKKETGLNGTTATANYGDKFVGNGVIGNSETALVGANTSGHELIRIDEGLSGR